MKILSIMNSGNVSPSWRQTKNKPLQADLQLPQGLPRRSLIWLLLNLGGMCTTSSLRRRLRRRFEALIIASAATGEAGRPGDIKSSTRLGKWRSGPRIGAVSCGRSVSFLFVHELLVRLAQSVQAESFFVCARRLPCCLGCGPQDAASFPS